NDSSKISRAPQSPNNKPINDKQTCSSKDYKQAEYKYYLPYVISWVVICVGAICWFVVRFRIKIGIEERPQSRNSDNIQSGISSEDGTNRSIDQSK
ncbi:11717_t:CDS:1, partial [Ambispora gerdemannii]